MPITGHNDRSAPGGQEMIWALPESMETETLMADLENAFKVRVENEASRVRKWFDTDDWRLYRRNFLLFQESGQWHLLHRGSDEIVASFFGRKCELFRYFWDFPVSRLRTMLEPVLSIRSIQPLFTQESSADCVRIMNKDRKKVASVYFDDHVFQETGAVFRSVTLKGIRGYDENFHKVSKIFSAYGLREKISVHKSFEKGVLSTGRTPRDYSSKFSIVLKPEMSARQAMIQIYCTLFETMQHNYNGVAGDMDTEFLHDYRVAIRRTRSGLAQVKKVLPSKVEERVKQDFAWLGKITGSTRDLDVYLLDREKYMGRLPKKLRPNLEYFFADIAVRRDKEQKKLVSNLQSEKFRSVIEHWNEYLHGHDKTNNSANAERPVTELACEIIFRKYGRVMKDGGAVKESSPDEELHRLRIQCKKLRYTLEFFASLFPAKKMKRAIKQLKRLQDNLGTFNDLSVQQDMLRNYLAGLKPGSRKNQELATAIGGLLTNLHHEHQKIRNEFASIFHHFSCEENQKLYTKLFR